MPSYTPIVFIAMLFSPFVGSVVLTYTSSDYVWYLKPIAFLYPHTDLISHVPFPKMLLFSTSSIVGFGTIMLSLFVISLIGFVITAIIVKLKPTEV